MSDHPYPKRAWWLVLVAVPLAAALLPRIANDDGGRSGVSIALSDSDVGGSVQLIGRQTIFNELKTVVNDPGQLARLQQRVDRALSLLEKDLVAQAAAEFDEIAREAPIPSALANLGVLRLRQGDAAAARPAHEAGVDVTNDPSPLRERLAALHEDRGRYIDTISPPGRLEPSETRDRRLADVHTSANARDEEVEPNARPSESTPLRLGRAVRGTLASEEDTDYYAFHTPGGPRDRIDVRLVNRSDTLKPVLTLFNADKRQLWQSDPHYVTGGEDVRTVLHPGADQRYHLAVTSVRGDGEYDLVVQPRGAYDPYEPNPSLIAFSRPDDPTVNGDLLDGDDEDFFRFSVGHSPFTVRLTNGSADLVPRVRIWGSDKALLWDSPIGNTNAGQNLSVSLEAEPSGGGEIYVAVSSLGGTGAYVLSIEPTRSDDT